MPQTREPKDNRGVWLPTSAGRIAHHLTGTFSRTIWRTKCGRVIQDLRDDGRVRQYGSIVEWRLLNHDLVRPCRRCYR